MSAADHHQHWRFSRTMWPASARHRVPVRALHLSSPPCRSAYTKTLPAASSLQQRFDNRLATTVSAASSSEAGQQQIPPERLLRSTSCGRQLGGRERLRRLPAARPVRARDQLPADRAADRSDSAGSRLTATANGAAASLGPARALRRSPARRARRAARPSPRPRTDGAIRRLGRRAARCDRCRPCGRGGTCAETSSDLADRVPRGRLLRSAPGSGPSGARAAGRPA